MRDYTLGRRHLLGAGVGGALAAAGAALPEDAAARVPAGSGSGATWRAGKRYEMVRGLRMAYHTSGRGDPIVLLHGNPTSSYLWRRVVPPLQALGRCIAPDLIGMGDSAKLPQSGDGSYRYDEHRDYLFALLDALDVRERVTLVIHDWGSALGLDWAQQHPQRVRAIVFMEPILKPPGVVAAGQAAAGYFSDLRSEKGEQLVLVENQFVERMLIDGVRLYLTDEDMAEYRRPYLVPGESRRPTLSWPRELPIDGTPERNEKLVQGYSAWLAASAVPKLFVRAVPGAILRDPAMLQWVRGFRSQAEVLVYGGHFVQEVSGEAIGRAIAQWLPSV